jgi:hypothetical protein
MMFLKSTSYHSERWINFLLASHNTKVSLCMDWNQLYCKEFMLVELTPEPLIVKH